MGFTIAKKLHAGPHQVFAMHRPSSDTTALKKLGGVNLVQGDLTDPASLEKALKGIDVVICTANTVSPATKNDTLKKVDVEGVQTLITLSKASGVKQFIYTSAKSFGALDDTIPLKRAKKTIERHLFDSGIPFTIFQPTAFMDVYFPYFGTTLPVAAAEVSTVLRPFKFGNDYFEKIKNDMAEKNRFNVVGKGKSRCSLITVDNVADFHAAAVDNPLAMKRVIEIGGPEPLSAMDVRRLFEEALGKTLTVKATPLAVIWLMAKILAPFNPHAANLMSMNYASAKTDMVVENAADTAKEFGVTLQSAGAFIRAIINSNDKHSVHSPLPS